jgi:hypothetical protein
MSEMDNATYDAVELTDSGSEDIEAPEADAFEQHRLVREDNDRPGNPIPYDVNEADAAEQGRVVELDEDDYR